MSEATTPLTILKGEEFNHIKAYLKDESHNLSGTVKDRRSRYVAELATRMGVDRIALITAGSNGLSLSCFLPSEIALTCVIDKGVATNIKKILTGKAERVIEVNLQYKLMRPEEVITVARERDDEVIWDVTNGYEEGYCTLVKEIVDVKPDFIVVPIGSGSLYVASIEAVNRHRLKTKVIGIGVKNTLHSFADKLHTPWTPYQKVMSRYHDLGHTIYRLDESEVRKMWDTYKNISQIEPSSSVVFAALEKHQFPIGSCVVFINTGRAKFAN